MEATKMNELLEAAKAERRRQERVHEMVERSTDVSALVFAVMAQSEMVDDVTITEHSDIFAVWDENWTGGRGTILQDEGRLFRALHDIGAGQNAKPSETPSLWQEIGNPADEYPMWVPFLGVGDAYRLGDKVTHNGKKWICTGVGGDGIWNVWEPGVWGWEEVR
ncbi:MAG: alpha-amylase [Oscillospiraceae bacterium]|nr:alpha-amylase [Oscillospiraceae bacterium]